MKIAGIDVHKKVLMVVVVDASVPEEKPARRRFVTLPSELQRFRIWFLLGSFSCLSQETGSSGFGARSAVTPSSQTQNGGAITPSPDVACTANSR